MTYSYRPHSYSSFLTGVAESIINFHKCVSCTEPFSEENTYTYQGWRETQISGLCESCYDSLFEED